MLLYRSLPSLFHPSLFLSVSLLSRFRYYHFCLLIFFLSLAIIIIIIITIVVCLNVTITPEIWQQHIIIQASFFQKKNRLNHQYVYCSLHIILSCNSSALRAILLNGVVYTDKTQRGGNEPYPSWVSHPNPHCRQFPLPSINASCGPPLPITPRG